MAASIERDISTSINVKPILVGIVEIRAWAVMAFSIQDDAQFSRFFWVLPNDAIGHKSAIVQEGGFAGFKADMSRFIGGAHISELLALFQ